MDVPIYGHQLYVSLGESKKRVESKLVKMIGKKKAAKFLKRYKHLDIAGTATQYNEGCVLWLREFPQTCSEFATLVHECCHITEYILRTAGIEHTEDTSEAYAYLNGWLYQQITMKINYYSGNY